MKRLEIPCSDIDALGGAIVTRNEWLRAKLEEAGFDVNKTIVSWVHPEDDKWIYTQKDISDQSEDKEH
jgi:hypothetical protein